MKNRILIYPLILMGVLFILTFSCKKDDNNTNTVKDIDGNVYHTVTIGTQTWMVENLNTTKYRNGDPIPNITDDTEWKNLTSGAYCDYINTPDPSGPFGRLYNWFAVNDSRNIAPNGWHIPTDDEWTILTTYLGGEDAAGNKLKEAGSFYWGDDNTRATNETGFTALPGGFREPNGTYGAMYVGGWWWSSTEYSDTIAWIRYMHTALLYVVHDYSTKGNGYSIRCLRD